MTPLKKNRIYYVKSLWRLFEEDIDLERCIYEWIDINPGAANPDIMEFLMQQFQESEHDFEDVEQIIEMIGLSLMDYVKNNFVKYLPAEIRRYLQGIYYFYRYTIIPANDFLTITIKLLSPEQVINILEYTKVNLKELMPVSAYYVEQEEAIIMFVYDKLKYTHTEFLYNFIIKFFERINPNKLVVSYDLINFVKLYASKPALSFEKPPPLIAKLFMNDKRFLIFPAHFVKWLKQSEIKDKAEMIEIMATSGRYKFFYRDTLIPFSEVKHPYVIKNCAYKGYYNAMKFILDTYGLKINIHSQNNYCIRVAVENNDKRMIKLLKQYATYP